MIIIQIVWFDENSYSIKLLNASFGLLQDDPFYVVSKIGSLVIFFSHSTGQLNFVHVSTQSSTSMLTSLLIFISTGPTPLFNEKYMNFDQPDTINPSSAIYCLSRLASKKIEAHGSYVDDVSSR